MKQIEEGLLPQESETLSQKDLFNEYIMTGLRTQWGVSLNAIKTRFGPHFAAYLEEQVTPQLVLQNVFWDGDILKISQHARFLSDGIASDLFLL
jgi:oxygen-independent coproporphyrinogen-3 oxidase